VNDRENPIDGSIYYYVNGKIVKVETAREVLERKERFRLTIVSATLYFLGLPLFAAGFLGQNIGVLATGLILASIATLVLWIRIRTHNVKRRKPTS
jgi:hypothetical protein